MEKLINITKQTASNADIVHVHVIGGITGRAFMPHALLGSDTFKETMRALFESVETVSDAVGKKMETMNLVGMRQEISSVIKSTVAKTFQATAKAGTARMNELENRRIEWLNMKAVSEEKQVEIRQVLRSMAGSPQSSAALVLSSQEASTAALKNWELTGLPKTLRESVENTLIIKNLAERFSSQVRIEPNAVDPLANGFDQGAAQDKANQAVANYEAGKDEVDTVRTVLISVINFIAAITNLDTKATYELLTGKA